MRIAEEILEPYIFTDNGEKLLYIEDAITVLNKARKETIEHIASLCTINDNNHMPDISQEDILKLIDEIK